MFGRILTYSVLLAFTTSFKSFHRFSSLSKYKIKLSSEDIPPADFSEEALEELKNILQASKEVSKSSRDDAVVIRDNEEIYRKYPFTGLGLPLLNDHGNYYSGKSEGSFWHQNSDQIFVFIPVAEEVRRSDVKVDFSAKDIKVHISGNNVIEIKCMDRIIPDGSFWVFETDSKGQKYVQLDLEKRFRMINWKYLFSGASAGDNIDDSSDDNMSLDEKKKDMLEKLFAANKGMAKLTGKEPELIEEMSEEELQNLYGDVDETPRIVESKPDFIDVEVDDK